MEAGEPVDSAERVLFEARLQPNRSLSQTGFAILMLAVSAAAFGAGLTFYLIGAWPVVGFMGLDVLLVYIAFRLNYRQARAFEQVRLTRALLTVLRVTHHGRRYEFRFQPYWLRLDFDNPPDHHSQIRLTSHGRSLVLGSFLAPAERADLAVALQGALAHAKASGVQAFTAPGPGIQPAN